MDMLNTEQVRSHFPALASGAIFFDNPGGTQVAQDVIQRMTTYFLKTNANHGGAFHTSQQSDALIAETRQALADFLNARRPDELIFGQNMTSLTFHISRSIARRLQPGDELVVTRLDHDANISPWLLIAEDRGCQVRWVDINPEDCTLNMAEMERLITPKTKVVAVGYASNAMGTVNDVKRAVQLAHQVGALCYIDAVQFAPHKPIDVQDLDCDFLACSAYKFFGPHTGILYGKYELLDEMTAYKVRPADNFPPDKYETGTPSFESIAGVLGALEHLEWVGTTFGAEFAARYQDRFSGRALNLKQGMAAIEAYELDLSRQLITGLQSVPGLKLYGITDLERLNDRVPTFSFTLEGWEPQAVAAALNKEHIYVWDGNYYALAVMERLGIEGMVRVGLSHINTAAEIEQLIAVLKHLMQ
jgi:cysteine desulfurase family protein (TIGR01976 family)